MGRRAKSLKTWWPGTELNRRRQPFQGCALPPELPGHFETRLQRAARNVPSTLIVAGLPNRAKRSAASASGALRCSCGATRNATRGLQTANALDAPQETLSDAKDRARLNAGVQFVLVKERFRPADLVERIRRLVHSKPPVSNEMEAAS